MDELRVTLLGPFRVSRGTDVLTVPGTRLRGLLIRLALGGGHPVRPGALIDAIWGEDPPSAPGPALHTLISRLRRALAPAPVEQVAGGYRLMADVDALRFERLAATGRQRLRAGSFSPTGVARVGERSAAGAARAGDVSAADLARFGDLSAAELARAGDLFAAKVALAEAAALWGERPGAEPAVVAAVAPTVATRLAQLSIEVVADLAEAELSLGHLEAAADRATALLASHPIHERAAALLMDALATLGREAEALAVYERLRESLFEALGADPGTALKERHLRLLRPGPAAEPPDSSARSRPPGRRAAPGSPAALGRPVAFRPAATPGPPSASGPPSAPRPAAKPGRAGSSGSVASTAFPASTVLPAPTTSFVGRDDDLARINALLAGGRLVTILGPGGAGKTRLALEAIRRRADVWRGEDTDRGDGTGRGEDAGRGDGAGRGEDAGRGDEAGRGEDAGWPEAVWFVELAAVSEAGKVGTAVLGALGLRGGALLDSRRRAEDVIAGEVGGRAGLLLVDNCEHLVEAVAFLVAELLARCPGLKVLATSREPLAIDGEALVPLGPLTLPASGNGDGGGVEDVRRAAAVRLFVARAEAVRAGFDVDVVNVARVRDVVRKLDGMPLALELAAARLRTLSLDDLVAGLDDRFRLLTSGSRTAPARHRNLRAVIAWSWDLLDDRERVVAERISVLPGGVAAASAAAVCAGTPVGAGDVPDLLAALVDRSLLQLAPGRYRMLESIREYGAGRAPADARDLAAAHFTSLLVARDRELRGPGQLGAIRAIGAEYDNVIAALRHRCASRDSRGAITLALALTWFWQMSGRQSDGAFWLAEALAVPDDPSPERDCARAVLLLNRTDLGSGITVGDRSEMRELGQRILKYPELSAAYRVFGAILLFLLGELGESHFAGLADGEDLWLSGLAHMFLAEIAGNAGDLHRLRTHVESSLAQFRRAGDRWGRAGVLPMRAQLRRYDDLDGALADLTEARELASEFGGLGLGDQLYTDMRWIDLYVRRGETDQALALVDAARERARHAESAEMLAVVDAREAAVRVRLGHLERAAELLGGAGFAAERAALRLAHGDLVGAEVALREAYAVARDTGELPALAPIAVLAAAISMARGEARAAAVLLGVAARLRGAHDHTDPQVRELTVRGRSALGEAEFDAAYARGWELDAPAAVAHLDPGR